MKYLLAGAILGVVITGIIYFATVVAAGLAATFTTFLL